MNNEEINELKRNIEYQLGVCECVCHVDYPIGNCDLCDAKRNKQIITQMEQALLRLREFVDKVAERCGEWQQEAKQLKEERG